MLYHLQLMFLFCCLVAFSSGCDRRKTHESEKTEVAKSRQPPTHRLADAKSMKSKRSKKPFERPKRREMDPQKVLMKPKLLRFALKAAVDNDDMKSVFSLATQAANSQDRELRLYAVENLAWYGDKAIPELLPFLLDEDQEVITEAYRRIDQALDGEVKQLDKIKIIERTMDFADDEDQVVSMLAKLETVNPLLGVSALTRMMEKTPKDTLLADLYREEYEFLTGKEYTTPERARMEARVLERKYR